MLGSTAQRMTHRLTSAVSKRALSSRTSQLGLELHQIETPALVLEMNKFDSNLERMAKSIAQLSTDAGPVMLRPHAKSHKSAQLALMQCAVSTGQHDEPRRHNTVGVCVSKISEAEALVRGGVQDILITNQIVSKSKIERLAELADTCKVAVCVDNPSNVDMLQQVFSDAGKTLDVLVEVEVGQGRCGVAPGAPCAALASKIASSDALHFAGIQCYSGWNQHVSKLGLRTEKTDGVVAMVKECLVALAECGLKAELVTGGGTGTWALEGSSGVFTELQPGSYAFMDVEYAQTEPLEHWCDRTDGHFDQSLFVACTVTSDYTAHPNWLVVDAGDKAVSPGSAFVQVAGSPELTYRRGGDEHGIVEGPPEVLAALPIGSQMLLVPGHCDPTINLYNEFIGVRKGVVTEMISIDARGPGQ